MSAAGLRSKLMTGRPADLVFAAIYVASMTAAIYGVLARSFDPGAWIVWVVLGLNLALGFVVPRCWALVLPLLVVIIAYPAEWPENEFVLDVIFPIWAVFLIGAPVLMGVIGIGCLLRMAARGLRADVAVRRARSS